MVKEYKLQVEDPKGGEFVVHMSYEGSADAIYTLMPTDSSKMASTDKQDFYNIHWHIASID